MIAAVDGLSGFPDAIRTIYPQRQVQLCIVHMIRNSLKFVSFMDRSAVIKLVFMALQNIAKKWTMPIKEWNRAFNQLAILFADRVPA
jgi:putative transposase